MNRKQRRLAEKISRKDIKDIRKMVEETKNKLYVKPVKPIKDENGNTFIPPVDLTHGKYKLNLKDVQLQENFIDYERE